MAAHKNTSFTWNQAQSSDFYCTTCSNWQWELIKKHKLHLEISYEPQRRSGRKLWWHRWSSCPEAAIGLWSRLLVNKTLENSITGTMERENLWPDFCFWLLFAAGFCQRWFLLAAGPGRILYLLAHQGDCSENGGLPKPVGLFGLPLGRPWLLLKIIVVCIIILSSWVCGLVGRLLWRLY